MSREHGLARDGMLTKVGPFSTRLNLQRHLLVDAVKHFREGKSYYNACYSQKHFRKTYYVAQLPAVF